MNAEKKSRNPPKSDEGEFDGEPGPSEGESQSEGAAFSFVGCFTDNEQAGVACEFEGFGEQGGFTSGSSGKLLTGGKRNIFEQRGVGSGGGPRPEIVSLVVAPLAAEQGTRKI